MTCCQLICPKLCARLMLFVLALNTSGCGGFFARRMAQAPNTYPAWLAPAAPVELAFGKEFLPHFQIRYVAVGPPPARLCYRVVEPADYRLNLSSTNWLEHGQRHFRFGLDATLPGKPNAWTPAPRGTVLLLHGYGIAQFGMAPWALRLAQEGWRCVLVDLRGHGKSTGRRIYFGIREASDLSQLLDALARDGELALPVAALGESYGAALALRWKTVEPRVSRVVAIAPYAELSEAALNICHEYAPCLPQAFVKAGLKHLPAVLAVEPGQLDTTHVLAMSPIDALFAVGTEDKITPPADVRRLYRQAAPGSELIEVPEATHEAVAYFFNQLVPPVLAWLGGKGAESKLEPDAASEEEKTGKQTEPRGGTLLAATSNATFKAAFPDCGCARSKWEAPQHAGVQKESASTGYPGSCASAAAGPADSCGQSRAPYGRAKPPAKPYELFRR